MPVVPDENNSNTAAAAAAAANAGMQNVNIASILNSTGPIVTAVLLKAGGTRKEKGEQNDEHDDNVVEAVQVDTTPKKQMVAEILGGPFTFLGQYEEEGIVLMIRKDQDNHPHEGDNNEGTKKQGLARNQHPLQPPFQTSIVWGDILCLKVAPDDEDDAPEEAEDETADAAMQVTITPKPNEEFFLNYTKEEYVQFAARTDVVYTPPPDDDDEAAMDDEEEEEEETAIDGASTATNPPKLVEKVDSSDEEDDDGDAPYEMEDQGDQEDNEEEGDDEEGEEGGFLELLMGQVLQRFEHENGRMPDAAELKALEAAITEKLGGMQ